MRRPEIIKGDSHTDQRGTISFINDFDMDQVKRFYMIDHPDKETIRGWRAHRIEQRWFYVISGEFSIQLVKIDHWDHPDKSSAIEKFILTAANNQVLHVPVGYGSSIQATKEPSKVLVFADYGIENAKMDDYLYPQDYFKEVI